MKALNNTPICRECGKYMSKFFKTVTPGYAGENALDSDADSSKNMFIYQCNNENCRCFRGQNEDAIPLAFLNLFGYDTHITRNSDREEVAAELMRLWDIHCGRVKESNPPTATAIDLNSFTALGLEQYLADTYKYKPLPLDISEQCRSIFKKELPPHLADADNSVSFFTKDGTLICTGYERIVIGDYGAFIEFNAEQAALSNFKVKQGQEYRINDPKYSANVKYRWYTAKDESDIKIYHQQKTVSYADYRIGMYYVSPHEIHPARQND